MLRLPSHVHVRHLVTQLRHAAIENQAMAMDRDDGGFGLCLGAALANDAAGALEALLAERTANDEWSTDGLERLDNRNERGPLPGVTLMAPGSLGPIGSQTVESPLEPI